MSKKYLYNIIVCFDSYENVEEFNSVFNLIDAKSMPLSGKAKDVKFKNFLNIIEACGFGLELVKGNKRIPLHSNKPGKTVTL